MSEQIIIADASPLIALARIEHIHLLRLLFDEVSITQVVEQEVLFGSNFADAAPIERAIQAGWLRVETAVEAMQNPVDVTAYVEGLDPGETSSILLAAGLRRADHTVLLVIDEAKGRSVARRLSLNLMGSAGIIATAKLLGFIPAARPLLERLRTSGYYLSNTVVDSALKIAGE